MVLRPTQKPKKKVYRCKYCQVQVLGRNDFRAVLGREHAKHCPRHK